MKQVPAQSKLKQLLVAICLDKKQRFYEISVAKTEEGELRLICDSKLDDLYLKFGEERITAIKPLKIISTAFLKVIDAKKN